MAASLTTQTVHAIVLRRRDAGESDRRLTLLTQELGLVDATARGARKSGSRLAGVSEPATACILGLSLSRKTRFVSQAQPISSFPKLRLDFDRLTYALALCELASTVVPHEAPADASFALMVRSLSFLEVHESPLVCLLWAESQLMALAGFKPELELCVSEGQPIRFAEEFVSPHAGGFVGREAANRYSDAFPVRAEVLIGSSRIAELEEPPASMKYADESFAMLARFWEGMADTQLPVHRSIAAYSCRLGSNE